MPASINKVIILGLVSSIPKLHTINNNHYYEFLVTTDDIIKNKNQDPYFHTEWHKIIAWDNNIINKYIEKIKKNSKIYIEGYLSYLYCTNKNNNHHQNTCSNYTYLNYTNYIGEVIVQKIWPL